MRRALTASALFAAGLFALSATAQPPAGGDKKVPPAKSGDDPFAEKKVADNPFAGRKPADPLEKWIEAALASDPDVRMARAKIALAEAELAKARQQVVQKVVTLNASIQDAKRAVAAAQERAAWAAKMHEKGMITQAQLIADRSKLEDAQATLARLDAELKLLIGMGGPGGVGAATGFADWAGFQPGLNDHVHRETMLKGVACTACHVNPFAGHPDPQKNRIEHFKALMGAARASEPVKGPVADTIRAALDRKVRLAPKGEKVTLEKALEVFRKDAGLDVPVRANVRVTDDEGRAVAVGLGDVSIVSGGEELPVVAWLQLYQDFLKDAFVVYVREYGLLITNRSAAPPDAVSVIEFWKQKPAAGDAAGGTRHFFERAKVPAALKVRVGDVIAVTEDAHPIDIADFKADSDNPAAKVSSGGLNAKFAVWITAEQPGKAKVSWKGSTKTGKTFGHDGLVVEVE